MKTVIIGQQPNNYNDEGLTLPVRPGSSGHFLTTLVGGDLDNFDLINVSPFHDPEGFAPSYHKKSAKNLLPLLRERRVILLGPAVATAFGFKRSSYDWCEWFHRSGQGVQWSVIPHPSGVNRLYNDQELRIEVSIFLRSA